MRWLANWKRSDAAKRFALAGKRNTTTWSCALRNLEKQISQVRDQARGIDNPLRDWPEFERTLAQARDARSELMSVHQALNTLPQRLQTDLALLDEAKQIDIAKVDKFVPGDLSNTSEFGIDMMAGAVRDQIQTDSILPRRRSHARQLHRRCTRT